MKIIAKPLVSLFDVQRKGYSTSPKTIGQQIRNARLQRGMSQEKFAAMIGVSARVVQSWEVDRRGIASYWRPLIAKLVENNSTG